MKSTDKEIDPNISNQPWQHTKKSTTTPWASSVSKSPTTDLELAARSELAAYLVRRWPEAPASPLARVATSAGFVASRISPCHRLGSYFGLFVLYYISNYCKALY
jgi:hypothetical protein